MGAKEYQRLHPNLTPICYSYLNTHCPRIIAADAMDLANFWDSPLVSSVAFHRRAAQPSSGSGSVRDGVFTMSDGAKVCYRLRLPTQGACDMVVYHFHGNAEVCTDADAYSALFTSSKAALLSIDFRGTPVLAALCALSVRTVSELGPVRLRVGHR